MKLKTLLLSFSTLMGVNSLLISPLHAQDKPAETKDLMELSLEELMNIQVTVASKQSEKISDAAGVISVITKEEMEAFGGITLRDILERVPSLIGTSSYFTDRYYVAGRGDQTKINSGHNLILINGRPTREIVEGGVSSEMYAAFPVDIIERIEVIRGPGSVLYGSNAFSMVINVVTKKSETNNLAVKALTGGAGAYGASADGTVKLGEVSIALAGRYMKKADWNTTYTGDNFADPSQPLVSNAVVPDEAKGAYLDVNYKNLRLMSSHNEYHTVYFQNVASDNRWTKTFNNLGYDVKVKKNWNMNLNVTYNYATMNAGYLLRKSNDVVAELTNHIDFNKNGRLIFGGLYNYIKGKEDAIFGDQKLVVADSERGSLALYSQVDYWVAKNLKLIGGFQANKVQNIKLDVVPRGGVIWYPVPRINVKALYSQAFRAASVDEVGLQFPGFSGNPNIKPEKVASIDMGINYLGEKIQGGVNYFHNKQSNIIVPGFLDNQFMYINHGNITFQGIELEAKYYATRNLFFTGSMLYQESKDDNGNKNVTPIANFGAKAGLSYKWNKGITASLFNIYQGKLSEAYTSGTNNPKAGSYNMLRMYCSFDMVKLMKLHIHQNISAFVQADNLLNKQLWLPDWGGSFGQSTPVNPGRTVYVGLKASLR
jgi:outer membrane receptor for ferrienterochelin and colicins